MAEYRERTKMVPIAFKPLPHEQYNGCPEIPYPAYERIAPMDVAEYFEKWQNVYPTQVTRAIDAPAMHDPDDIQWAKSQPESDWPGLYDRELFYHELEWDFIRDFGRYLQRKLSHFPITLVFANGTKRNGIVRLNKSRHQY